MTNFLTTRATHSHMLPLLIVFSIGLTNVFAQLPPLLTVVPNSVSFGTCPVGTTKNYSLIAMNSGGGIVSGSATVAPPFSIVSGGSYSLVAGASVAVVVSYSPTNVGAHMGLISFTGGGGANVAASGYGILPPVISVTPAVWDFGGVLVGTTAERAFTVANIGGDRLTGSASVSPPFSIVSGINYDLTNSQAQSVVVRYSPIDTGAHLRSITFTGAGGATNTVSARGSLTAQVQLMTATLSNGAFGFLIAGPAESNCVTEGSSDLVHWNPLATNLIPWGGALEVRQAATQDTHFYRAVLP